MEMLTEDEIKYLESIGFKQDKSISSFYFYEDEDGARSFIIPQNGGMYKLEIYEYLYDGDGNHYEDYTKLFSREDQTLKQFIEEMF